MCCNGIIAAIDSCLENGTEFSLITGATINTINWSFGDPASGANNTSTATNPAHTFSATGNYTVTATVTATCGTFSSTFPISIINCLPPPPCTGTITFADTCLANGTAFQINSTSPIAAITWDFGDVASGVNNTSNLPNPTHTFSDTGSYTIQAMVMFECGPNTITQIITIGNCFTPTQPDCPLYIPNACRPNDDGQNDAFTPSTFCTPETYSLTIYNRWGSAIYQSNNLLDKWDGKYKGKPCQPGVYVYSVHCKFPQQAEQKYRGSVTLLR
ncbi:MAG: gliding motility-associated C-terminal domain-containing protein [Sphingobacteriales bacterium JAD_PAG50586_3]|nr:MAG: gliding motility-associated C-terminal domain-containing protein [Sphingobacteriales bacterium JAD_PAG50586_3]